jgi:hypothetical protein
MKLKLNAIKREKILERIKIRLKKRKMLRKAISINTPKPPNSKNKVIFFSIIVNKIRY